MVEKKQEKTEQEYVIPLRGKFQHVVRYKKTPKAVKSIKEFLARHMKVYDRDLNKIKLDKYLNEFLWARGIKNPPHKIRVKAIKEGENVKVELVELPNKLKFKKLREEKVESEAKAKVENKKTMMQKAKENMHKQKEEKSPDENKEGVEDSKEVEEKKESVKKAGEKMEKDLAKQMKHTSKAKSGKEKLADKKGYNQTSRGK